jgi:sec-independent protein translocase protein TatB
MQMFGVGVLELMVILVLIVIVVGPDKMPQVAADLARWIRQTRAYARHLLGDFNDVIAELEKEAGASREDWQEIASVITRNTGAVGQELTKVSRDLEQAGDLSEVKKTEPDNVVAIDVARPEAANGATANGNGTNGAAHEDEAASGTEAASSSEDKPWYEPERISRRRSRE